MSEEKIRRVEPVVESENTGIDSRDKVEEPYKMVANSNVDFGIYMEEAIKQENEKKRRKNEKKYGTFRENVEKLEEKEELAEMLEDSNNKNNSIEEQINIMVGYKKY